MGGIRKDCRGLQTDCGSWSPPMMSAGPAHTLAQPPPAGRTYGRPRRRGAQDKSTIGMGSESSALPRRGRRGSGWHGQRVRPTSPQTAGAGEQQGLQPPLRPAISPGLVRMSWSGCFGRGCKSRCFGRGGGFVHEPGTAPHPNPLPEGEGV